jgi:tetratricopeptide (TPR) repeat protein
MACGHRAEQTPAVPPLLSPGRDNSETVSQADRFLTDAFAFSDEGRLTEAVRLAQQALRLNPNSTTAHSLLGTLYERLGDRDAAIREYQSVLSLSPGSTADRKRLNELLGLPATPQAPKPGFPKLARRSDTPQVAIFVIVFFLVLAGVVILWQRNSRPSSDQDLTRGPAPIKIAGGINPNPQLSGNALASPDFSVSALPTPGLPSQLELARGNAAIPNDLGPTPLPEPDPTEEIPPLPESEMPPVLELPDSVRQALVVNPFPAGGGRILTGPLSVPTPHTALPSAAARMEASRSLLAARQFVVAGRLQEASQAYETSLAIQPASPRLREELATVYFRLQKPKPAADNFITAYNLYSQQLRSGAEGVEAEAAEHGLATCRAALRALGFEVP